jgi:hypothetical protein
MNILLQPLLQTLTDLSVNIRDYGDHILLSYDQLKSPRESAIVHNCRGTVVRKSDMKIVRRMFPRFFNLGEFPENDLKFQFENCTIESKEDGSIIGVWYNELTESFEIGTNGTPNGESPVQQLSAMFEKESLISFKDLFIKTFTETTGQDISVFYSKLDKQFTYCFELCTMDNKVVHMYEEPKIFLLGCFNNISGYDTTTDILDTIALDLNVHRPLKYSFTTFDSIVLAANLLPDLQEGFVLRDVNNLRLKVKSDAYLKVHHLKGNFLTPVRAIELCLSGEYHEYLAYCPEYKFCIDTLLSTLDKFYLDVYTIFNSIDSALSAKDFAESVKHYPCKAFLFKLKQDPNFNLEDHFKTLYPQAVLRCLKTCT